MPGKDADARARHRPHDDSASSGSGGGGDLRRTSVSTENPAASTLLVNPSVHHAHLSWTAFALPQFRTCVFTLHAVFAQHFVHAQ